MLLFQTNGSNKTQTYEAGLARKIAYDDLRSLFQTKGSNKTQTYEAGRADLILNRKDETRIDGFGKNYNGYRIHYSLKDRKFYMYRVATEEKGEFFSSKLSKGQRRIVSSEITDKKKQAEFLSDCLRDFGFTLASLLLKVARDHELDYLLLLHEEQEKKAKKMFR
ncbi:MAG: hypothetical protein N3G22_05010 [Candidatus Micrarchaeota archaeon]|nr:hypothetical protein [Candidatus Micrarchaeota archaeon]